jgi:hypothetical protein
VAQGDSKSGGSFWTTTLGIITQLAALVGAVAAIVGVVAAGKDDEKHGGTGTDQPSIVRTEKASPPPHDPQPTREDWVRAINSLCGQLKSEAATLGPSPRDVKSAIEYQSRVSTLWQRLIRGAEAVPVPEGDQSRVDQVLSAWNGAADQYGQLANDIAKNDEASFNAHLEESQRLGRTGSETAIALGAHRCSGVS